MVVKITSNSPNGDVRKETRPRQNEPVERPVCRYLGLGDDRETWLAFPSPGNYCHFVEKPAPVDVEHQLTYCLTENHLVCPVFELKNPDRLPAEIAFSSPGAGRRGRAGRLMVTVLVIILILAVIALLILRPSLTLFGIAPPESARPETIQTPPATQAATVMPAAMIAVSHPRPTPTATGTPMPAATQEPPATASPTTPPPSATPTPTATTEETTPAPSATPILPQIVVNVITLNVRSGPGVDYPVIDTIDQDTRFNITGQNNNQDWLLICCLDTAGTPGWVFSESVTVEGPVNSVPVVNDIPPPPTTETP